nr:MAG TPA: nucelotide kinase [Caudoviricetes sp.]
MNTNSKHYETLNIQPWEIMERNFTTEEFVAYLKGNIIKYTLRDKGQALTDAEKIKHYAEKLIEVIEKKETDEFLEEDAERIYGKAEPVSEYKFKVGDRVRVLISNKTGTIIRTPVEESWLECNKAYIIELDNKDSGWEATKERHLVDSENAWYVNEADMELLKEEPKKVLKPNKWYDAEDFTEEELEKLLPVGTKVVVTEKHDNDREVDFEAERLLNTLVKNIGRRPIKHETRIGVTGCCFWRRYFKIVEE